VSKLGLLGEAGYAPGHLRYVSGCAAPNSYSYLRNTLFLEGYSLQKLSSQERILRTVASQPVDRIPIHAPIRWDPLTPEPDLNDWKAQPNYQQLIALADQHCDFLCTVDIPEAVPLIDSLHGQGHQFGMATGIFDRRFFLTPPEYVEAFERGDRNGRDYERYRVWTPKGDLTTTDAVTPGVDTVWSLEYLIKDTEDVEKILSIPYRFDPPDVSSFVAARDRLGDRGVTLCFVTSPLVMVSRLMDFQQFLMWTITERPLIDRLINIAYERLAERLRYVLDQGVGPIIRFGGCEQATPPMMPSRFFDEFIIKYESPLWKMVRQAGQIPWVHCHGKIATVIDKFVAQGVQLLDPVEPPPQGDIEFKEAKKRAAAGSMTLIGNIEMNLLETGTPDEVEAEVQKTICEGGKKHLILGASDYAISVVDDHLRDNIVRFIEAGVKYGTFNGNA
jgi:hypothetical protein